ncbi:flagellar hook-associated protein FlgK [Lachnotalea glycerini]|uniref:Flagellar hook-associated protein 1 n=1 Tax=Lachnotalea glycerini TaxID=1763509 RepID=A0A371JD04_9FIRM|nr:flagellar hook-associated protein FlgK [Lachnotalea glycerini]RDY30622.1 flagellar hook-associated protein FlgK [Lachnotalea glycerini]
MGGMGSLYIGVSGLQTSQNALNTTAHNLANIGTDGYVRQQVVQSDTLYNTIKYGAVSLQQVGIGSTVAQVRQVRDIFLDQSYRLESGRSNYYDVTYNTYYEIESILGTLGGSEFSDSLDKLSDVFNSLSTDPSDTSVQTLLKQRASEFIEDAQNVYSLLKEYQNSLNDQVADTIDDINELANTINELNQKIELVEAGGVENANDLRDSRNSALDELAGLINISYSENSNGVVTVSAEGVPLVTTTSVNEMGYTIDDTTGFITPTWPDYKDKNVYNMNVEISTEKNTNVGKLKALLVQRGSDTADYSDIPVAEDYQDSSGNWTTGSWTIDGTTYTDGKSAYSAAKNYYDNNTSLSGMMNTLAEFDQLIHSVVTKINDILCPNTTMTVATGETWTDENGNTLTAGETYTCLDVDNCGQSADGTIGTELFSRGATDRYTKYTYTDTSGEVHTSYIYNEEDTTDINSMYTTENLKVNSTITDNVEKLPLYTSNGAVDYEKGLALYSAWTDKSVALNPNSTAKSSFQDYYSKLVDEVGNMGYLYKGYSDSQASTVSGLDDDRQMVIGVSSDEELSNMLRYQNAYNACSRYINVVSEMLETIITSLGRS